MSQFSWVIATTLLLAACGGSSDEGSETSAVEEVAAPTSATPDTTTTTTTATTTTTMATTTTEADFLASLTSDQVERLRQICDPNVKGDLSLWVLSIVSGEVPVPPAMLDAITQTDHPDLESFKETIAPECAKLAFPDA